MSCLHFAAVFCFVLAVAKTWFADGACVSCNDGRWCLTALTLLPQTVRAQKTRVVYNGSSNSPQQRMPEFKGPKTWIQSHGMLEDEKIVGLLHKPGLEAAGIRCGLWATLHPTQHWVRQDQRLTGSGWPRVGDSVRAMQSTFLRQMSRTSKLHRLKYIRTFTHTLCVCIFEMLK